MIDFAIQYGYAGMFLSAFVAGSFLPFSSEAVMVALMAAGLKPVLLLAYASIGNWGGSMVNYWIGRQGKMEWIEQYLHVKHDRLKKTKAFMEDKGAWVGILSFLPVLGTAICVALGLMRANITITAMSVFVGKLLRYAALAIGTAYIF